MRAIILSCFAMPLFAADLEPLLPEDSEQVTYVQVKKLATSKLFKDMLKPEIENKLKATEIPKWLKAAGIDPWKDIDTFSMVMNPPKKNKEGKFDKDSRGTAFVVARGTFNTDKILETAEKAVKEAGDSFSIQKSDGLTIVAIKDGKPDSFYITMADEKTILAATKKEDLLKAVKRADEKVTKPAIKNELSTLIASLDDKAAFYQAMFLDGKDIAAGIQENPLFEDTELLKKQVAEITCYSTVARVGGDVTVEIAVGLKNAESAKAFGETAKVMVEKGRLLIGLVAASKTEFTNITKDLSRSMKAVTKGDAVILSAKVSGDSIAKAFGIEE